ncbi:hypothetical protein ElyMa_002550600 [Elysia marginata]|uniref:Uncharacterized protein n=1 Tax=Elysia marginata TaxID=1093978 RepID=A0AAV4GYN9_9GAST|nr:hypothetical protein ElyMa_002550600 [Elysia marginata]
MFIPSQVSVISPSSRTHYLNVTPGNIVFAYTPTRDAAVTKRPWRSVLSAPDESTTKDLEVSPSLQEIIAESQRELSESLRNFHSNQRRGRLLSCSPNVSSVSSPSLFSTGISQRNILGSNMRFQTTPVRPGENPRSFGVISRPRGHNPISRFQNHCLSESPLPSLNRPTAPRSRQPFSGASVAKSHPPLGSEETSSYMISGEVAVRQKNTVHSHSLTGVNSTEHLIKNPQHSSKQSSGLHKSSDNHDFDFDFPGDNEDEELLQFYDETLSNGENINTEALPNQFRQNPSMLVNSHKVTSDVISKVFRDCEEKNIKNFNPAYVERKSSSGKTFTFKRHSPSSHSKDEVSNFQNKRKCMTNQQSLIVNQTNGSSLTSRSIPLCAPPVTDVPVAAETVRNTNNDEQCHRQRESKVQLGQRPISTELPASKIDALSHWDDDLTDDLLLSQLSEEF